MGKTEGDSCTVSADSRVAARCGTYGKSHEGGENHRECSPVSIVPLVEWRPDRDRHLEFYATLLAMAAHDLRQPLQIIVTIHEMLAEQLAAAERAFLERAERASAQLTAKLDFLIEALRVDLREGEVETQLVPLEPVLQGLAREFEEPARSKGVSPRIVESSAIIRSNPFLIDAILHNLVANAITYSHHGGRVAVGCRRRGALIRIEIRDNGRGISAEDLTKVFDAFQRRDATRPEGLGLGLFIVQHAAALLGLRFVVRSRIGRGSCFAVIAEAVTC